VENVVSEIKETVDRYKIVDFQFFDETFNLNPQWTIDFCNEIIRQNISISWRARCRPDLFTREVVQGMKKAGCRVISMGVESANDNTLKWFNKGYSRKQVQDAMDMIAEEGIELHGYFILGAPVETKEDMVKTIELACKPQFSYATFSILTPLEGTKFLDMAIKEGYLDDPDQIDYSDLTGCKSLLKHPSMTKDEIKSLYQYAYKKFYFRLAPILGMFKRVIGNPFLYCKMVQRALKGIKILG
jgi:anaerobic magnesium-protoporphyrin IX monomethyl ester cyclase